jgi:hypothetical protein
MTSGLFVDLFANLFDYIVNNSGSSTTRAD